MQWILEGSPIGAMKRDTRSLDYSSCRVYGFKGCGLSLFMVSRE